MHDEEKIIQRMTHLLHKEVFDELTSDERNELEDWLKSDPSNHAWYEQLKTLGFVKRDHSLYKEITAPEKAWKHLENDLGRNGRKRLRVWVGSVAAVFLVILGITLLMRKEEVGSSMTFHSSFRPSGLISLLVDRGRDSIQLDVNENIQLEKRGLRAENNTLIYDSLSSDSVDVEYHTLSVARGGEYRLTLSDGTVVWLNSESALRYPIHFAGNEREVELWGEAFFEVSHDEKKPFKVRSGDFEVEVLGTSFDIMNYTDEQVARVTLSTGKLRVNKGKHHVVIQPNQQVQLGDDEFEVREVDARYYTSWIDNKFIFDDESLEVIMRKLARWYNMEFEFADTALMKTRFTGQLLKYKDITKAFELLELTTDVEFSINQKKILIMRKKS